LISENMPAKELRSRMHKQANPYIALLVALPLMGRAGAADKYVELKAQAGAPGAQCKLATKYKNGIGVPINYSLAAKWYRAAAEQGVTAAQVDLANLYENGLGVPQDYAEALKWSRIAASAGNVLAENNLGNFYLNGKGVSRDLPRAQELLKSAAEKGVGAAMYNSGLMHENGEGVSRDLVQAYFYYNVARVWQSQYAPSRLAALAQQMTSEQINQAQALSTAWATAHKGLTPAALRCPDVEQPVIDAPPSIFIPR
jgi:TPR repeat protein